MSDLSSSIVLLYFMMVFVCVNRAEQSCFYMIYSHPLDIMIKKKCVFFPLFVLEWHFVCLVPAVTSSGTTESLQAAPNSYNLLCHLFTRVLFPVSLTLFLRGFVSPPAPSVSKFWSVALCVCLRLHVWICLVMFSCVLSALCKGRVMYSFKCPVSKRPQGLWVR